MNHRLIRRRRRFVVSFADHRFAGRMAGRKCCGGVSVDSIGSTPIYIPRVFQASRRVVVENLPGENSLGRALRSETVFPECGICEHNDDDGGGGMRIAQCLPSPAPSLAKSFSACQLLANTAGRTRQNISLRRRRRRCRRRRRRRVRRVRVFCFAGTTSPGKLLVSFLPRRSPSLEITLVLSSSFPLPLDRNRLGEFKKVVQFLARV